MPWNDPEAIQVVEMPNYPSGQRIGKTGSMVFGDFNGDGDTELWIGGPRESMSIEDNYGAVWSYSIDGNGIPSAEPTTTISGHSDQRANEYFGSILNNAGDMDQDGYDDLIIASDMAKIRADVPDGYLGGNRFQWSKLSDGRQ